MTTVFFVFLAVLIVGCSYSLGRKFPNVFIKKESAPLLAFIVIGCLIFFLSAFYKQHRAATVPTTPTVTQAVAAAMAPSERRVCDFKGKIVTIVKQTDGSYSGTLMSGSNQQALPFTISSEIGDIRVGQFFNRCVFVSNE